MQENIFNESNIFIENRAKTRITGVIDVDNFDDFNISVKTDKGYIIIGGEELKINKLDVESGELHIEGKFNSLIYNESVKSEGSIFGRIFK